MDQFHQNVIEKIDGQVTQENEEKMIGKRFRLNDGAVESKGDVQTVGRNENQHPIEVTWTREKAVFANEMIEMNVNAKGDFQSAHVIDFASESETK